jgi:hypothetical protein
MTTPENAPNQGTNIGQISVPSNIPTPALQTVQVVTSATTTAPETVQTLPQDISLIKFISKKYPWITVLGPPIVKTFSAAMRRVELAVTAGITAGIVICYTNYEANHTIPRITGEHLQTNTKLIQDLQIAVDGFTHTNSLSDIQTNSQPKVIAMTNTVVTYKTNN